MLKEIFLAVALTSSPQPAENYNSWISPAIADIVQQYVLDGKFYNHLDFNGDGELSIADVVGISKRYQDNVQYGNEITLDYETIIDIGWENFSESLDREYFVENELLYWEIYRVNDSLCRQYELTVSEIATAEIYFEFEDFSDSVTVEINPYEETITVIS